MTENKRFIFDGVVCKDNVDKSLYYVAGSTEFEKFVKKAINVVNELTDENEQLKQQVAFLEEFIKTGVQYEYYQKIYDENKQLKQQIKIFEKFLEVNDLSIDWEEFCGVDECAFENPDFSCKECIHLKGDVE